MLLTIIQIAGAILLARIVWVFLPALLGLLFTAVLAILAPGTAIRYFLASRKREAPKAPEILTSQQVVDRAVARYITENEQEQLSIKATSERGSFR